MKQLTPYFEFVSRTPVLIFSFVMTWAFLNVIFPQFAGDLASLDVRTDGYDYAEVVAAMEGYGEAGRRIYAWVSPTLDTLFPLAYVSLYAGVLYRFAPNDRLRALAYVPVIGGFVDLAENMQITAMLVQYPDISIAQVDWANRFTLTKFIFTRLSLLMAAIVLVLAALQAVHKRWKAR
jgi:hypothetical protein